MSKGNGGAIDQQRGGSRPATRKRVYKPSTVIRWLREDNILDPLDGEWVYNILELAETDAKKYERRQRRALAIARGHDPRHA